MKTAFVIMRNSLSLCIVPVALGERRTLAGRTLVECVPVGGAGSLEIAEARLFTTLKAAQERLETMTAKKE